MNLDFNRRLSIAPMLDCTDRHERYFLRLISRHVMLYSEMVVTHALLHGDQKLFLGHESFEYPVALQLGGSNPSDLAKCCKLVESAGFQEVNLNCGCPSDRVQSGSFGACLMKDKQLVADCFKAMQDAVSIPVSIKCRIGVDDLDSWEFFRDFVQTIADAGCRIFIIHARKAWLKGLSPKENREVPPLHYDFVYRLKKEMPQLNLSINGGICSMNQVEEHLGLKPTPSVQSVLDGVMVGREAYENPWFLKDADARIFNDENEPKYRTRKEVLAAYLPYVERQAAEGCPTTILVRHLYGLFAGMPGARKYRQVLSEGAPRAKFPTELILRAMDFVTEID
ncbi:MAG: tRNA dihydrouridine(20/20a) synthase DusA [Fibrobacter sp.]|nr:tRNA dihydrouridine(20/20a) synthase DusA [Fibrobacter sp.]